MAAGDRWKLPDGREGIEVSRTVTRLKVLVVIPNWPFPGPPLEVLKREATLLPSRYLNGELPEDQ